jgi:hypothetical protein
MKESDIQLSSKLREVLQIVTKGTDIYASPSVKDLYQETVIPPSCLERIILEQFEGNRGSPILQP